tara:strand:+ start:49747 stop:51504 length:1758 start_codon:yes stop_codon:yes gene_type:complete
MFETRAMIRAGNHAISAGHDLATKAGMEVLQNGGNAIDAGVAAGIALGVLHSDLVNFAGVAPIMIRLADSGETVTIDGLGVWPKLASVDYFEREHGGAMPEGLARTVVPAAPAAWIEALIRYGTMSYGDVARFAASYAREGFPTYPVFAQFIADNENAYRRTAAGADIYLPGGRPPVVGDIFVQSDLAATIQYMIDEEAAAGGDRIAGLRAARDAFYRGDIARTITDHHIANGGFLRADDMADYQVRLEAPMSINFGDAEILTCGPWCQGFSLAQAFKMLNGMDIRAMAYNSADYVHTLTELFDLVFADRETHITDPAFADIPVAGLLDESYLAARRGLINPAKAFGKMPPAGNPHTGEAILTVASGQGSSGTTGSGDPHHTLPLVQDPASADTSYVAVIDRFGNMFSATPSDTSADTEVIPGTGLCPSSRGSQSRGTASSLNAVAPGKRPRLTPNPAMAIKDGKPLMAFGTPGGDVQIQAMIQVYLNRFVHGMDIQQAIEAPRFASYNYPSSFAPNSYHPGLLMIENSLHETIAEDLNGRGHKVECWQDGTWKAGGVLAVVRDPDSGEIQAGADPRRAGTAWGA